MLKREPVQEFMKVHGLHKGNTKNYIGIAADEPKRVHDDIYPLFEWGITEAQALDFCYSRGFDWGGTIQRPYAPVVLDMPPADGAELKAPV